MTHVAYLQIDYARGLLRACAGKMTPLIFAPHKGWKRNASPLAQRAFSWPVHQSFLRSAGFASLNRSGSIHQWWYVKHRAIVTTGCRCVTASSSMWEGLLLSNAPPPACPPKRLRRDNHFLRSTRGSDPTAADGGRSVCTNQSYPAPNPQAGPHVVAGHGIPGLRFLRPILSLLLSTISH